jgi:gamma-glutamylcyclotransferase (GGCT)/AIG2-like uncharacterized protein YtfP
MREYLFAYGTLADDTPQEIAATVKQLKFVGEGFIFGRLYDVGEYPGAVLDDTRRSKVFGKIFEIGADPSLLQRLDKYEGFNRRRPAKSLFVRKRIVINRPNKAPLTGWVYEYNRDLKSTPVIKTGRYSKVSV